MAADAPACRCGHPRDYHRHLHTRGYCGTCGPVREDNPTGCSAYRRGQAWLADGANRRIHRLLAIIRRRR